MSTKTRQKVADKRARRSLASRHSRKQLDDEQQFARFYPHGPASESRLGWTWLAARAPGDWAGHVDGKKRRVTGGRV
jgi:hypothetical protein